MALQYRPEIDGLRAVAVVPVILFHAGFSLFSGGFIGVDVFFVISGYLITSIILRELEAGTFSFASFYERRARRILPALFLVMLCCIPFAWMWMMPMELKGFAVSVASVVAFASNIIFWRQSGYFDTAAELKPLLHTWSLAVEEQFYIIFPIALLLVWRFGRKASVLSIAAVAIGSLVLCEYASRNHPSFNFYWAVTRAWELLAGALCAFVSLRSQQTRDNALSALGLTLILFSIFWFDSSTRFPSIYALLPVAGACLIILFGNKATITARLLSIRPIVGIGLISYSAYLWHQPLFAFARIASITEPSMWLMGLLALAVFPLAWLTWRYVETPFRSKAKLVTISRPRLIQLSIATAIGLVGFGVAGHLTLGFPNRYSEEFYKIAAATDDRNPRRECIAGPNGKVSPATACTYGTHNASVAIIGDSHAHSIAHVLGDTLQPFGRGLVELTMSGCPPIVGIVRTTGDGFYNCDEHNRDAFTLILSDPKIDIVIIVTRWTLYVEDKYFDNKEGGREGVRELGMKSVVEAYSPKNDIDHWRNFLADKYTDSIRTLLRHGKRIVLVYQIPEAGWDVPRYIAKKIQLHHTMPRPLTTSYSVFRDRNMFAHSVLDTVPESDSLLRIKPEQLFCEKGRENRCMLEGADGLYYYDDDHLSTIGAGILVQEVIATMRQAGWLN